MEIKDEIDKVKKIYSEYEEKILNKNIEYNGLPVITKKEPMYDNMCGTFWHIITKDYVINQKFPCIECINAIKCTSIGKYNPLISNTSPRIICKHRIYAIKFLYGLNDINNIDYKIYEKYQTTKKGKKHRIYFLDDVNNYLTVFDKKNDYLNLWTAFPIGAFRKNKYIKEYNNYIKQGTPL